MKRYFFWLLALPGLSAMAQTPTEDTPAQTSSARFVLCNSYCAVVDAQGNLVTPRVFEELTPFTGPVAIHYRRNGKAGAINQAGETIIPPRFGSLRSLGGLYLIGRNANGSTTLFDTTGRIIVTRPNGDWAIWGGHPYYQPDCRDAPCKTEFFDDQGQTIAEFFGVGIIGSSGALKSRTLAVASTDGKHFGLIDHSLAFVVPPRYTSIDQSDYLKGWMMVYIEGVGSGLLDATGREVVPPGRYNSFYIPTNSPFMIAYKPGVHNCATLLRLDGSEVKLPKGVCPDSLDHATRRGYGFVKNAQRLFGVIDTRGKILMPPTYPFLKWLDAERLVFGEFGNDSYLPIPTRTGVVDLRGKIILPLQPAQIMTPLPSAHNVYIARGENGFGLLDSNGRWVVSGQSKLFSVMSPDLVWLGAEGRFYSGKGEPLALTSTGVFSPRFIPSQGRLDRVFVFYQEEEQTTPRKDNTPPKTFKGLADAKGHVLIPARYEEFAEAETGLWRVKTSTNRYGLVDEQGKVVTEPVFWDLPVPFIDGRTVAKSESLGALLIDREGKTITSFNALFPDLALHSEKNTEVEPSLDRCFNPDPAAEPDEITPQDPATAMICADTGLRAQSRQTEKHFYNVQTGSCLPQNFLDLRPTYDRDIAACADKACLSATMTKFVRALDAEAKRCKANVLRSPKAGASAKFLTPALKNRLRQRIQGDHVDYGVKDFSFSPLTLGRRPAVLASTATGPHNQPFWLFLQNRKGQWQGVLTSSGGYPRSIEFTDKVRKALPVLRTWQHGGCCAHSVTYFAYDGQRYQPLLSCSQCCDHDETALLFCTPSEQ